MALFPFSHNSGKLSPYPLRKCWGGSFYFSSLHTQPCNEDDWALYLRLFYVQLIEFYCCSKLFFYMSVRGVCVCVCVCVCIHTIHVVYFHYALKCGISHFTSKFDQNKGILPLEFQLLSNAYSSLWINIH